MSKKSVVSIVKDRPSAENIVNDLMASGFVANDVSVLFPDKATTRDFAHQKSTKAPEGAVVGAGAGATLGGTFGALAGIGALAIPGIGPLIAAGPLLGALSGAAVGAAVGGITGALVGLGIPEIEAKRYEGKIRDGNILIAVHCEALEDVNRAKEIFQRLGGEDIATTTEVSIPHPSQPPPPARTPEGRAR